jgi:hypothetical protein
MEDLEKAILVNQLEQKKQKKENYTKPELFIQIEKFIRAKQLIGYGGTAINRALPKEVQFYQEIDIPDYDFFSTDAKKDLQELADLLYPTFKPIEVKPSMFKGTYKLFVNYLPLVDMTQIEDELFKNLSLETFLRDGIPYVPYNYLRMSMHQELSRPLGDLTRWTKVFQRLELLNKYHPFLIRKCDVRSTLSIPPKLVKEVVQRLKDYVLLGDYAMNFWQELFPQKYREKHSVLFVLSETIEEIWNKLNGLDLRYTLYENKLVKVYEIYIDSYPMLYVILSDSCMNYNLVQKHKLASYDTCLTMYYGLSFVNIKHLSKQKLLSFCYLLSQIKDTSHPLMRRFQLPCYGKQSTLEDIRKQREQEYKLKNPNLYPYRPSRKKLTTRKRIKAM